MKRKLSLVLLFLALAVLACTADVLRFSYTKGEKYRMLTRQHETVAVNGKFSQDVDILNKIAVEVTDTRGDSGRNAAVFQASSRSYGSQSAYQWSEDYSSDFWRDSRGKYTIDLAAYMPVVRDVPTFPEGDIQPGYTWTAPGYEVHDLRKGLNIETPFRFPITVTYTFLGREKKKGVDCALIGIEYTIFHKTDVTPRNQGIYPIRISGRSSQKYWWDTDKGREVYYEEDYDLVLSMNNGDEYEFYGKADGERIESAPLDKKGMSGEIQEEIRKRGIADTSVKTTDEGVMIVIENVNFPPNSDSLLPAEQEKVKRIAEILRKYSDRDISITGHTARAAGYSAQDYQKLSEKRAKAVGDYLLQLGARTAQGMSFRGMGDRVPLGDNSTEQGRKKNRRVEITILEN